MKTMSRFLVFLLSCAALASAQPPPQKATLKVGVIMDLTTPVGQGSLTALSLALSDFTASHPNSAASLRLLPRHSPRADPVSAASEALDLISTYHADVILGPQTSDSAAFVADIGAHARIPVISFSATSPSLSAALSPFFIRAAPSDAAMAPAIAALASAFSWRRLVPIYEDSDFGASLIPNLVDALSSSGDARIPYRCPISSSASDDRIAEELYHLKTLQTRVFVLHAPSALASRILSAAALAGMTGSSYAWILSSAVASQLGSIKPEIKLGSIGVRPYIKRSKRVRDFERQWRIEFIKQNPNITTDIAFGEISPFIYYAYDALWAVATAADAVISVNYSLPQPVKVRKNSARLADIFKLGISDIGPKLLESIRETEFDGISGGFRLVAGEMNVSAFQIVNVKEERATVIGFWTPASGLSRYLKSNGEGYSVERGNLGPVIWSEDSVEPPKGWEIPTGGEKMKIVVPGPAQPGFQSFLSIKIDPVTHELITASGFVIEVFEAAVRRLPYALPYEYVSWVNKSGKSAGDYNTLVKVVFNETFDGVVGDVTITPNRSEFVDFTLPYTVSGVSMVVPVRDVRSHRAWVFLKPLTTDLWLVSVAFFVLTGVVVWFLEHRINPEFRGPVAHQLGTVFYFTFSTLVFAHKERIMSNLSKLVMVIWVFVVLILTSSYTASLTSMLTVRQFQPTITDFRELIVNRQPVGYLHHSFVKDLLRKKGFHPNQLFPYKSPLEYKDALSNGTVVAIIDEIPYLKVFLKDFCENFTMGSQIYKTSGFGFVFPKGSSLVPDLSRAILNLTDSEEMVNIERRWFGDQSSCPSQGSSSLSRSNSLDFNSFYGLFLITGVASVLALLIYSFSFCYGNRHSLTAIRAEEKTFKRRVTSIVRLYDEKDLASHTFRKSGEETIGGQEHTSARTSLRVGAAGSESPISISIGTATPPLLELASPQSEMQQWSPAAGAIDEHAEVEMVTQARS